VSDINPSPAASLAAALRVILCVANIAPVHEHVESMASLFSYARRKDKLPLRLFPLRALKHRVGFVCRLSLSSSRLTDRDLPDL
jgi:hypothetical protein